MSESKQMTPEPWLRGTLRDVAAVPRSVLHALELAQEDLDKWCRPLTSEQLTASPCGLSPVAFHLRHIARSMDRLLTYAEGGRLQEAQVVALRSELAPGSLHDTLFAELDAAFARSGERVRGLASGDLEAARVVGEKLLPTTLGGLLVHLAEHTQRHVGQAITTAKLVAAL